MAYKIEEIEGIGPTTKDKLARADIHTTADLLKQCCIKEGRKTVSKITGCLENQILKWANMADLMRISGVGGEFSELLEASGVDTVKELRHRNPENLAKAMKTCNDEKNLTRTVPSSETVKKWIEQAKDLDALVYY